MRSESFAFNPPFTISHQQKLTYSPHSHRWIPELKEWVHEPQPEINNEGVKAPDDT